MIYARFRLWLLGMFGIKPEVLRDSIRSNRILSDSNCYSCPLCGNATDLRGEWPATIMHSWGSGSAVCRSCVDRAKTLNAAFVFANARPPLHFRKRGQSFEECVRKLPNGGTIVNSTGDGAYWREEVGQSGPILAALRSGKLVVEYADHEDS